MSEVNAIKGYKQTEVGLIPEDWNLISIKEVARLINGRAYKQEELLLDGKYRVLRVGNFFSNSNWYYSDLELPDDQYVFDGDLMYAWSASFGPRFWTEGKTIYHYHIWKVMVSNKVDKTLLYHLFEFDKQQILKQTQGGTMFHITKTDMEARLVPLPPTIAEQTAIATALSDMDNLIAGLEQLIEKKKAIKQGAMQELLRPKEGWVVKKLGDLGQVVGGGTPSSFNPQYWNGNINWFTPTEIGLSKYLCESERKITKSGLENSSAKLLPKGTVLLTTRAVIGDVGILQNDAATNQGFQSIIVNDKNDNEFIYYLLSTLKPELLRNASGSTFLEISPGKLKAIEIYIPGRDEQQRISEILSDMDNNIKSLEENLEKHKVLKQGMMQELLTGKTRLV